MKTLENLKKLWEKEKEVFKTKELGGLQSFVRNVLECEDLFNLKQGLESTKIEDRKYEITIETSKKGRQADFVIFIKGDEIVIPVEVEKYENIEAGVKQLANYQNDWKKAYGILTDGYYWRFYNNTAYSEFHLDEILDNPSKLVTFWKEYIKEENYYLSFFEETSEEGSLFAHEEALKIDDNRELFFEDITKLIKNFKDKLDIVGYLRKYGNNNTGKKATEISYAYLIQYILYKNLVDNYYGKFNEEFKNRVETIYNGLKNKAYQIIANQIYGISDFISDKLYKPFSTEQEYITDKLREILRKPKVVIEEVTLWLDIIVFIKKYDFANMQNEIFGFVYENYLKELYEDKKKGQHFTDPAVVNFMLDELGYTQKEIKRAFKNNQLDKLSIIDPSCGSGTFLYSVVNRIVNALFDGSEDRSKLIEEFVNNNVFGLDIAEFPLYLAEMNILMRMLPIIIGKEYNNPIDKKIKIFKTRDSISEFMNIGLSAKPEKEYEENEQLTIRFDDSVLNLEYKSFIRDEDDLKDLKKSMMGENRYRFDYVIGNPPYVDYNSCCRQKVFFTQIDAIKMNDIYNVNLNTVPGKIKKHQPKPDLYSFFISLGFGLLKNNSKICYIIPQTLFVSNDLDVMRYFLSKYITLEKIITFDGKMFIGRGLKGNKPIATSSLIFIAKKSLPEKDHLVEIINFQNKNETDFEKLLSSYEIRKKKYLQEDLLNNIKNWNFINKPDIFRNFVKNYYKNSISIHNYRNSLNDYDDVVLGGNANINKKDLLSEKVPETFNVPIIDKNKTKVVESMYGKFSKFKQASGSRKIQVLLSRRYKILWRYQNPKDFYFVDMVNSIPKFMEYCFATDCKQYALFLFSLLRSKINTWYLKALLLLPQEKAMLVGLRAIKTFIRVPKYSEEIYEDIINQTEKLFKLEDCKLKDFVDFSKITIQRFDSASVLQDYLVLTKNDDTFNLKILDKNKFSLVADIIKSIPEGQINLTELKNMEVIDKEEQSRIKSYIDDLIFSLYFDINIRKIGFEYAEKINKKCAKNEFYVMIDSDI